MGKQSPPRPEPLNLHAHIERVDLSTSVVAWSDVATITLARILVAQRNYTEAAEVYTALAVKHPAQAWIFKARAEELLVKARGRTRRSTR